MSPALSQWSLSTRPASPIPLDRASSRNLVPVSGSWGITALPYSYMYIGLPASARVLILWSSASSGLCPGLLFVMHGVWAWTYFNPSEGRSRCV